MRAFRNFENLRSGRHALFQSALHETLRKAGRVESHVTADHAWLRAAETVLRRDLERSGAERGGSLRHGVQRAWAKSRARLVAWLAAATRRVPGLAQRLPRMKQCYLERCAGLAWAWTEAKISGDHAKLEDLRNEFEKSECDPGWLTAAETYFGYYTFHRRPMYRSYGSEIGRFVYPLPEGDLTVGLLGDWGTGAPEAGMVVDRLVREHRPDLIIHVGDVYYSGTQGENRANLDLLNAAREDHPTPFWGLAGNHDYYSGGRGFYEVQLAEANRPPYAPAGTPVQESSFFCLRNSAWQLQAMDTGYHDNDIFKVGDDITRLTDTEIIWHRDKLDTADGSKVVLFSHHQLFSAFENIGRFDQGTAVEGNYNKYLTDLFDPYLEKSRISAWFWGHEHLLQIYAPYRGLERGRCIGYSALPQLVASDPYRVRYPQVPLLRNPPGRGDIIRLGSTAQVYNHGFAVLRLRADGSADATYFEMAGDGSSPDARQVFQELF